MPVLDKDRKLISERRFRSLMCLGAIVMLSGLAGCSDDLRQSKLNDSPVKVHENIYKKRMRTSDIDDAQLRALSRDYRRHGGGGMTLGVSYNPASDDNTAVKASNNGAELAETLRKNGVEQVNVDVLPVKKSGETSYTLIHFRRYTAEAPSNCALMPGVGKIHTSTDKMGHNYQLGCTIDSLLARQVKRPRDLLGRERADDNYASGRRAGNIINRYREGEPNEPLEGSTATEQ